MPLLLRALPLAALAAAALTGCGSTSSSSGATPAVSSTATTTAAPAATSGAISGTLDEWSVRVGSPSAAAGKVTFDIANQGKLVHEFVVLKTSKAAAALGTGPRIGESGNVGETGDIAPGKSKKVTIALTPGHYSLVCNLPGHYMAGMHTDFTVK
jgi:uncharacterized cupredoxin-like copper-binding protein